MISANDVQRIFITTPRLSSGIPYSLATVSQRKESGNPVLEDYPSYEMHQSQGEDCTGITSVHRIAVSTLIPRNSS